MYIIPSLIRRKHEAVSIKNFSLDINYHQGRLLSLHVLIGNSVLHSDGIGSLISLAWYLGMKIKPEPVDSEVY